MVIFSAIWPDPQMLALFLLGVVVVKPIVRYSSVIQIKNQYSKNRLTVTTDREGQVYEQPWIYSSRPPFDDGWLWSIDPASGDINLAREPVKCGDNITLKNPTANSYIATRVTFNGVEVVPAAKLNGAADHWTVICNDDVWMRDRQIMLQNRDHKCYLTTSMDARQKPGVNKFNVTCDAVMTSGSVWKSVEGVYFGEGRNTMKQNTFEEEL